MIHIVKFLYMTFLLPPGIFIILLLTTGIIFYRKSRRYGEVVLLLTFLFYALSTNLVGNALIRSLESRYTPPERIQGDVIIMLGGGATLDTPNIGVKGHLTGSAANRLLTAAQIHRILGAPIIVTGGQVLEETGSEAEIASAILTGLGVEKSKVIVENASLNTSENAVLTRKIIEDKGFKQPILVTSAFHMERSVRQFEKVGIRVIPYPTDYMTNVGGAVHAAHLWPSAEALEKVSLALKEYIGIAAVRWY